MLAISRVNRTVLVALLAGLNACQTQVMLTPKLSSTLAAPCVISATVSYEGKADYLPRVISIESPTDSHTVLRYSYNTEYDAKQQVTALQLFNPLLISGFPTGSNAIAVSGLLEVVRDGQPVRTYAAACALRRSSTVFSEGETLTDLRHKGLALVRDNISAQMCQDAQGLQALLAGDRSTNEDKELQ